MPTKPPAGKICTKVDNLGNCTESRDPLASEKAKVVAAEKAGVMPMDLNQASADLEANFGQSWAEARGNKPSTQRRNSIAQSCFMLYNNDFFEKHHWQLLNGTGPYRADIETAVKAKWPNENTARGVYPPPDAKGNLSTKGYGVFNLNQINQRILMLESHPKCDSTVLNRIKSRPNQNLMDTLTPTEFSQLIPKLRLFKVMREPDAAAQKGSYAVEFEFNPANDLEGIINTVSDGFGGSFHTRGSGVGVKSFEWKYLGSDPYTATRDLEATLKIYFQSWPELTKVRERTVTIPAQGKVAASSKTVEYRYLDLIIQANCGDEPDPGSGRRIYDPGCYEIAVEAGWNLPTVGPIGGGVGRDDDKRIADLRKFIAASVERYYLTMVSHDISFEQDGTFELTINYRARLGSTLKSRKFNVLLPGGGNSKEGPAAKIEEYRLAIKTARDDERQQAGSSASSGAVPEEDEDPRSKVLQKQLDAYVSRRLFDFHNYLVSALSQRGMVHGCQITHAEWLAFMNFDKNRGGVNATFGLPPKMSDTTTAISSALAAGYSLDNFSDAGGDPSPMHSLLYSIGEKFVEHPEEQAEVYKKELERRYTDTGGFTSTRGQQANMYFTRTPGSGGLNNHFFEFIYFGDLLGVVLDWVFWDLRTNNGAGVVLKDPAGVVSDITWFSTLTGGNTSGTQHTSASHKVLRYPVSERLRIILGNVELPVFDGTGNSRMVNLAHIPIPYDAFLSFIVRKILSPKRSFYSLSSFIKDIVKEFITSNLNSNCFGGLLSDQRQVRTTAHILSLPAISAGRQPGTTIADDPITFSNSTIASRAALRGTSGYGYHISTAGALIPLPNSHAFWKQQATKPISAAGAPSSVFGGAAGYNTLHAHEISQDNPLPCFSENSPYSTGMDGFDPDGYDFIFINAINTKPQLYGIFDLAAWKNANTGISTLDTDGDKKRGIPHYTFGENQGLLKTVSFEKTDQEFLPEARYEKEGSNAINQLAAVYDVTFELVGTPRFQPGEYVYFDPITIGLGHPNQYSSPTARSVSNLMGLGGYHLIIQVSSAIKPGEYSTTLKTRWVTGGQPSASP
tara:strand:+ start:4556 stop:7780 length:3225 start_codon:yes stop_codon:yes gene_type:complete